MSFLKWNYIFFEDTKRDCKVHCKLVINGRLNVLEVYLSQFFFQTMTSIFSRCVIVFGLVVLTLTQINSVKSDTIFDWMRQFQQPRYFYLESAQDPIQMQPPTAVALFREKIMQYLAETRSKLRQRNSMFNLFSAPQPNAYFDGQFDGASQPDDTSSDDDWDYDDRLLGKRNNKSISSLVRTEYRGTTNAPAVECS